MEQQEQRNGWNPEEDPRYRDIRGSVGGQGMYNPEEMQRQRLASSAMVLGIAKGYSDPKAFDEKKAHYERVQEFAKRFKEQNGSIICRELLSGSGAAEGTVPERRSPQYYKKRPCAELCRRAAEILDQMLTEM